MKRILISFLLIFSLMQSSWAAQLPVGFVAGSYYGTDIVTTLNGMEIDAINIGGQTLISAEDMRNYGFSVFWDPDERTLSVYRLFYSEVSTPPTVSRDNAPTGTVLGHYYVTDIVTYLDGGPITAYNIGGRTYILAEEMRSFGYEVLWDSSARSLSVTSPDKAGYMYSIPLSQAIVTDVPCTGSFSLSYSPQGITAAGDADYMDLLFSGQKNGCSFQLSFYQNKALFASVSLIETLNQLCWDGPSISTSSPEAKYDLVRRHLEISVNGQKAEKISVTAGQGNGHRDYFITVHDLPRYKQDEIKDISIRLEP